MHKVKTRQVSGTVKAILEREGFGFITAPQSADIFFHRKSIQGLEWCEQLIGQRVECDVVDQTKGPQAISVRAAE